MAYPGPWQQGADVTQTQTGFGYRNIRQCFTTGARETSYASGGRDAGVLSSAATTERDRGAMPDWTDDTYSAADYGCGVSCNVVIGPTRDAPYPFSTGLQLTETGFSVSASGVISDQEANYAATIPLPPDATGVELAPEPFTVVSGAVTADMEDSGGPPYGSDVPTTGLAIDYYARASDQPVGAGRFVAQYMTHSDVPLVNYPVGLVIDGSDLDATYHAAVLWPKVNTSGSPSWSVSGPGPDPRTDYWNIHRGFIVLSVSTDWTIHPPRHRFLYATPQTATTALPPLRQRPRRDGLRGATAVRHWPPDRSVQASNRHAGGYY